jgi:hypothetical protein
VHSAGYAHAVEVVSEAQFGTPVHDEVAMFQVHPGVAVQLVEL